MKKNPARVILIGAGDRGGIYASFASKRPQELKIVAVADPSKERRERIAAAHRIPDSNVFSSWSDILERPRMADGAIIATHDRLHREPAVAALERGYRVLLEKPMALSAEECEAIVASSEKHRLAVSICHVLRYTGFYRTVKRLIDEGVLGDIYQIYHAENVPYYHMAHSFVRGSWNRSDTSSPMILAKCCHDFDLLYWFAGGEPRRISSFGELSHFTRDNAPEGSPTRCTDGCPVAKQCPYDAVATYCEGVPIKRELAKFSPLPIACAARLVLALPGLSRLIPGLRGFVDWREWPTSMITEDLSREGIMKALREGPYGRCVYRCDNDQADHQATIIEFKNGITAMLSMHGHSHRWERTIRIDGSRGSLRGVFGSGGGLEFHPHGAGRKVVYPVKSDIIGHTEGDEGVVENFVQVLRGGEGLSSARESMTSHLMAFAAHRSRIEGRVVEF